MELLTKARYDDSMNAREERNLKLAYRAAAEGIVLLENRGVLPLKARKIALYGAGAEFTTKGGTGSGEVNERHSVNVREGLENRGFTVTTTGWLKDYAAACAQAKEELIKKKRQAISKLKLRSIMDLMFSNEIQPEGRRINDYDILGSATDTCIYVISRQAGEGCDRKLEKGDYYLTDGELTDIKTCAAAYENFVLAINSGSQIDLSPLEDIAGIGAILYICQLGTRGETLLLMFSPGR